MLPRTEMLATKKPRPPFPAAWAALALMLIIGGCTPPGPRALLEGDRLLRDGKPREALAKLQVAARHLERDPRVWNWMGMAYQGTGDRTNAMAAYQRALALDARSNLVFAAHYNLGALALEQGNLSLAVRELGSFCALSNSLPALLLLGQAELRLRQLDGAERTLHRALQLQADHPGALNALGLVWSQRGRVAQATQCFQAALQADPRHGPALLNLAVVYHRLPGQQALAAQKYREYLALEPRPANWESVRATLVALERELAPPRPPVTNSAPTALTRTNQTGVATNLPPAAAKPAPLVAARTNPPPATPSQPTAATSLPKPPPTNASPARPTLSSHPAITTPPPAGIAAPPPKPPSSPTLLSNSTAPRAVVEVKLPEPQPLKPAQDPSAPVVSPSPVIQSPAAETGSNPLWVVSATPSKPTRKTLLQKLNPFGRKPKPAAALPVTNNVPPPAAPGQTVVTAVPREATVAASAPAATVVSVRPEIPRYQYLSPAKPAAGDRQAAEPLFAQGLKAQQEKRNEEALRAYRSALEKDPAYFEAYYNISLLAFQVSDWKASIHVCETALAVNPEGTPARLNLGLALEQAGYAVDAVNELEKVAQAKPEETRAHLALANLYAQKLGQPARARAHYLKVLELEPRHPRASEIRYWLAAHP